MNSSLATATKLTPQLLFRFPLTFLLLQLPLLGAEILFRMNMERVEKTTDFTTKLILGSLLWVIFFFASFLVQSATVLGVRDAISQKTPRLAELFFAVWSKMKELFIASIVIGLLVLVGMRAFILPGILLFALYLYVPDFIVWEPKSSFFASLKKSWKFCQRHYVATGIILAGFFVVFALSFLLDDRIKALPASASESGAWWFEMIDLLFSLVAGLWLHVWVASFFATQQSERAL